MGILSYAFAHKKQHIIVNLYSMNIQKEKRQLKSTQKNRQDFLNLDKQPLRQSAFPPLKEGIILHIDTLPPAKKQ